MKKIAYGSYQAVIGDFQKLHMVNAVNLNFRQTDICKYHVTSIKQEHFELRMLHWFKVQP